MTEQELKETIESLEKQLTGDMFQDMDTKDQIHNFYGANFKDNKDYSYIITERHANRLNELIMNAKDKGAVIWVNL